MLLDQKILQQLNEIGIALSKEHNIPLLFEKILIDAKELTDSDGGTIYMVTSEKTLHFEISTSDSLNFHFGGASHIPVHFEDLPLFLEDGKFNDNLMVAYAANHKKTINIKDAYYEQGFDFSGTRLFDEKTGYRTRSVLTVPMKNHEDEVIAVLQLINPKDGGVFSHEDEQLAESLASQAGVALTNQLLIEDLRELFESLIRVIAQAVDEKSPSTGNHSKRVPAISVLIAEAVSNSQEAPFKDIHFSQDQLYELKVAAFLHDCGKITIPDYVVEKQHKLQTLFDRIELVHARFSALAERNEKELLQKKLEWFESHFPKEFASAKDTFLHFDKEYYERLNRLRENQTLIERCNTNQEPITDAVKSQLEQLAHISYSQDKPLLTPDELENLTIPSGNLTVKEREIVQHHVVMTYRMLSQLKFPKNLKLVPEIAASHHEWVNGKGYPRGLTKEQMSIQARILAVADVFEALSAPDRPYKEALPLSEVRTIMERMAAEGHLDPEICTLFFGQKVYLPYARQFLAPEQIDN